MIYLASYVGKGRWFDRLIRWWTHSLIAHSEIAIKSNGKWIGFSSSPRDGGVRFKEINFESENWQLIPIPLIDDKKAKDEMFQIYETRAKYDWLGILGAQIFNRGTHDKKRWFCSELCAHIIGLDNPHQYSPGSLEGIVLRRYLHDI